MNLLQVILTHHSHRLWRLLALGLVLAVVDGLLILSLGPFFRLLVGFGPSDQILIRDLFVGVGLSHSWLLGWHDASFSSLEISLLMVILLFVLGVWRSAFSYVLSMQQFCLGVEMICHLRKRCFAALLHQSYAQFCVRGVSEWMSILINDLQLLEDKITRFFAAFFRESALLLGVFMNMLLLDIRLGMMMVLLAIPVLCLGYICARRVSESMKQVQQGVASMTSLAHFVKVQRDFVRVSAGFERMISHFSRILQDHYRFFCRSVPVRSFLRPSLEFVGLLIVALLFVFYAELQVMGLGQEELFHLCLNVGIMMRPLKACGDQLAQWGDMRAAWEKSWMLLREEAGEGPEGDLGAGEKTAERRQDRARFRAEKILRIARWDLGYTHNHDARSSRSGAGAEAPLLRVQDLILQPSLVALVGKSGMGKSLLLMTAAGLYRPHVSQSQPSWQVLSHEVSYVPQYPFLFSGSLYDNICYPGSGTYPRETVVEHLCAIGLAHSHEEGEELLQCNPTAVHRPFSLGMRQRVVLIRETLRQRCWLLCDEAAASLSVADELQVMHYLKQYVLMPGRGCIWVSHRQDLLQHCDLIYALVPDDREGCGVLRQLSSPAEIATALQV